MNKNISAIVFWGSVWGLVEATLGYFFHVWFLGIGWLFWFPLAFYFLNRVYRKTNNLAAVLGTSVVAASIKLVDLCLPTSIDRVINPAVSILLEGLVVFALFKIIEHKQDFSRYRYLAALSVSASWRVLYCLYILLMPAYFFNLSPLRAIEPFFRFLILESFLNSLVIYAYLKVSDLRVFERIYARPGGAEPFKVLETNADTIQMEPIKVAEKNAETMQAEPIKVAGWFNSFKRLIAYIQTNPPLKTSLSFSLLALAVYVQWVL